MDAALRGLRERCFDLHAISTRLLNNATETHPLQLIIVAVLGSLLLTVYVFGPFYSNAWSIIDDHEIFRWLGTRDKLPLTDFFTALGQTEVLDPSITTRFRPIYYFLRILETVFFGKSVALWYTAHTLIYFVVASILIFVSIARIARNWPERLVAVGGLLLLFGRTYWADTFARLGPAETYGILGVAIAVLGYANALAEDAPRSRWYVLVMIGSVVAAGSKENLLVLVLPLLVLTTIHWSRCTRTVRSLLVLTIGLLVADAAYVARIALLAGQDLYGNSTSLSDRLIFFATFLREPNAAIIAAVTILGFIAVIARRLTGFGPAIGIEVQLIKALWLLAACLVLSASQYAFYAGKLPANSRYDFPYRAALDLAILVGIVIFLRVARYATEVRLARFAVLTLAFSAAIIFAVIGVQGIKTNRGDVFWTRKLNLAFSKKFENAVAQINSDRTKTVILYGHRAPIPDWEPILSIARQLAASGVNSPIYLVLADGYEQPSDSAWYKELCQQLKNWSAMGHEAILPLMQRPSTINCISFGFNGPPYPGCRGVTIWPIAAS